MNHTKMVLIAILAAASLLTMALAMRPIHALAVLQPPGEGSESENEDSGDCAIKRTDAQSSPESDCDAAEPDESSNGQGSTR